MHRSGPHRTPWDRRSAALPIALLALFALVGAGAVAPAAAAPAPTVIASDGFGRPVRMDAIAAGSDVQVGIATGTAGPVAVWEDDEGLLSRPPDGSGDDAAVRLVESRGIRGLAAGGAGGDAVVAWSERDLRSGRTRLAWTWRGETRTVAETGQLPRMRLVTGAEEPELLVALPGASGWRLSLHAWDGTVREMEPRPLTVAGMDAVRAGDAVVLAWLEGSDDVVLGTVERDWRAYRSRWPDGADVPGPITEIGEAVRIGAGDVVRLAATVAGGDAAGGGAGAGAEADEDVVAPADAAPGSAADAGVVVHALWPGPDGTLRTTGPGAPRTDLGTGVPLGHLGGAWTWARGDEIVRLPRDGGPPRTVLRLPAVPERVEAAASAGVTAIAWSSGRYLGGLEVWAVTDHEPYTANLIERLAARMGWDPWRPWSAAGGHVLLAVLAAVLGAAMLTPLWWLGTLALGRRDGVSPATAALEGAAVAVATVLILMALLAWRATLDPADLRALVGGPAWIALATVLGVTAAWLVGRRQDLEPAFGRLTAAWIAGGTMLLVLAFGTVQAWQDLFGAVV